MVEESKEEEQEAAQPKKFVPPRGAMGMPMFDPSAIKKTLKKAPSVAQVNSEQGEGTPPSPFLFVELTEMQKTKMKRKHHADPHQGQRRCQEWECQ